MNILKKKMLLPIFVIAMAITGAFMTSAKAEVTSTLKKGYVDAPEPCTVEVNCDTQGTILCTDQMGLQAFGKINPNDTSCPQILYRIQ